MNEPWWQFSLYRSKVKTWYVRGMKATRNEQINNQIDVDICIEEDACLGVQIQSLSPLQKRVADGAGTYTGACARFGCLMIWLEMIDFLVPGHLRPKDGWQTCQNTTTRSMEKIWKNELEQRTRAFSICTYKLFLLFVISSFTDDTFSKEQSICDNSWFCEHTSS